MGGRAARVRINRASLSQRPRSTVDVDAAQGSRVIRIATRGSELARTQTQGVADAITARTGEECTLVIIRAEGDDLSRPFSASRPGVFTTALRDALVDGRVDVAVHSFKDLPSAPADGLVVAAIPPRATPFDAVVGAAPLASLPAGARVGTSSPRRAAALNRVRPDLVVVPLRGNIDTRVRKAASGEVEAVVVAAAGLERLGRLGEAVELLDPAVMLPAPAQGALAVECRQGGALAVRLAELDDPTTRLAVTAERAVLRGVDATCTTAVGALARFDGDSLVLAADLSGHAGVDYCHVQRDAAVADAAAAERLGLEVARALLSPARP